MVLKNPIALYTGSVRSSTVISHHPCFFNLFHITGKLKDGITLSSGVEIQIDTRDVNKIKLPFSLDLTDADNKILAVAYANKKANPKNETSTKNVSFGTPLLSSSAISLFF